MSQAQLNPANYYRLPWSLTDNGISWLEVTTSCNLACEGCYRPKAGGHKTLHEIASDLAVFKKERKSDCMSIAGGDPLVHPKIVDIVRMVSEGGWKPVVNTNGLALTPKLLKSLKQAGVYGFTFHVDTSQDRKDSRVTTEVDHNIIRTHFAEMVAAEGGMSCSFNQTVTTDTLHEIPDIIRWAQKRPDIIHTVVFILFRSPRHFGNFEYFANGKKIPIDRTYEKTPKFGGTRSLKTIDVVEKIREADPGYEPCAYLNGTENADSMKWTIATRVATKDQTYGYVSPRFAEVVQQTSHITRGKWLSYSSPSVLAAGRSALLSFGMIDNTMRKISANYLRHNLLKPTRLKGPAYFQSFTIIQPIDFLEDGRMNMCDGCPDMTVHKGKMYWSCRLEEIKSYGTFITAARPESTASVNRTKDREYEAF